jgi:hypothetical protein
MRRGRGRGGIPVCKCAGAQEHCRGKKTLRRGKNIKMKRPITLIRQAVLSLAVMTAICGSASAQLANFKTQVVVDMKADATATLGQFSPAQSITPGSEAVTLSVGGANHFEYTFAAGSFKKTFWGGYVAEGTSGTQKIGMLLQPLRGGYWAYSAAIGGFIPGSNPVTVELTVSTESGTATVQALVF